VWSNHIDAALSQFPVHAVRIIGVVADEASQRFVYKDFSQRVVNEGYFVSCCGFHTNGNGKAGAIATGIILVPLTRLVLTTPTLLFSQGEASINEGFIKLESVTEA